MRNRRDENESNELKHTSKTNEQNKTKWEEEKQTANAKPMTDRPTRCHWVKVKVISRKFTIYTLCRILVNIHMLTHNQIDTVHMA